MQQLQIQMQVQMAGVVNNIIYHKNKRGQATFYMKNCKSSLSPFLIFYIYFPAIIVILTLFPYGLDKLSSYIIDHCSYDFVGAQ